MFTKEEMAKENYTEENIKITQEVRKRLIVDNHNDIKQSEKDVINLMNFFKNMFLSELETYPRGTDRKAFIIKMLEISSKDEIICDYCESNNIKTRGKIGSIILYFCSDCYEAGVFLIRNK